MSIPDKLYVANRALQHVGQKSLLDLTTTSKSLTEINRCYDGLRRAELRRNVWTFSIRRATLRAMDDDTKIVVPNAWDSETTYAAGSLATRNGVVYQSVSSNTADDPETSSNWQVYFGPRTASVWDEDTSYFSGEMVLTPDGGQVLLSLTNDNTTVPFADDWDAATTYSIGDTVWFGEFQYASYSNSNLNNSPEDEPDAWDAETAYVITNQVRYLGNIYQASGSTTGDVPTDGAPWTLLGAANWDDDPDWPPAEWLYLFAPASVPFISYPLGYGPYSDTTTGNIFFLPANFMREAAQSPKAGSVSIFGAPGGLQYNDWLFENGFLLTTMPGPIHLRFAADVMNPALFDPMFVEGFAARIGMTVCEPLTQSTAKLANIAKVYSTYMGEARTVNAIEKGSEEQAQDDWISTRL